MLDRDAWEADELNYYIATLELHSVFWFSSLSHPHPSGFMQTQLPVIHNYPILLAFLGQIAEESYVSEYGRLKRRSNPASLFNETLIYVYPLLMEKAYYTKVFMSMLESDFLFYKLRTRIVVPQTVNYIAFAPGSTGTTAIISARPLPNEIYLRFGVKRYGVWRATLKGAKPKVINNPVDIERPFNILDVEKKHLHQYRTVMKHYAGDIADSGQVGVALELREKGGSKTIRLPTPSFISL